MVTKTTKRAAAATTEDSESEIEEVTIYESDLDQGGSLVGSVETNYANDSDYEGPFYLGPDVCRVILQVKTVRGEPLCCGTVAKDCARTSHRAIRMKHPDRVAEAGLYAGKRNNKDKVDGIITTFQSEADHDASKARDRASVDALSQSEQKKASEALMSPKQTNVTFDTSGAPPNSSPAVASHFPTPKRPAQSNTPVLRVDTTPTCV
jgi:hypothetical protein